MSRTPHAANALIAQVREALNRKPDSKAGLETGKASGDPDGFGRYRSVTFDKAASKIILAAKDSLEADPRVVSVSAAKDAATVTFVAGADADRKGAFDLTADEPAAEAPEQP